MIIAFDTSGPACLAAIWDNNALVDVRVDEMARGQAEYLMPMLEAVLAKNGAGWSDVTRIGVGVGPGNFTGIRISVSAARGLSLGLGIPAVGVSTLEAVHEDNPTRIAAVKAPRDMLYVQEPGSAPKLSAPEDVREPLFIETPHSLISAIARRVARLAPGENLRPKPLYIKAADAAPSRDRAPTLLS